MMMTDIFIIIFGLVIGSFLTVCIYRIPYGREKGAGDFSADEDEEQEKEKAEEPVDSISICNPKRSFCPECHTQLKWYHNIPFFSWLFLGGKCAFCKKRIPVRYPFVELLSAFLCYLSYHQIMFEDGVLVCDAAHILTALIIYALSCVLVVISFIDIDYYIIPNVISIPCSIIAAVLVAVNHLVYYITSKQLLLAPISATIQRGFYGFLAGAGILFAVAKIYLFIRRKEGLGYGDIKLLAFIGILLGPQAAFYTIMIGSVIGSVIGSLQLLLQGKNFKYPLPFGPYLAVAALLYIFTDPAIPFIWLQNTFLYFYQLLGIMG